MNVRNCRSCGKLFNYIAGTPICPNCKEELEKKFQEVKQYIYDNRNTTVAAVAEECDVDESIIRQWVREERLVFAEGTVTGLSCETCGAAITTGRYCEKCKAATMNAFSNAGRRPVVQEKKVERQPQGNKMRFLNQ